MITRSSDETRAAGWEFAQTLQAGDLVLLEGPLGSGKTTFVQGVAEGLGASGPVTSPSFVIVNEYEIGSREWGVGSGAGLNDAEKEIPTPNSQHPTPTVLRHLDLYRLNDPAVDLDRIGLPELLVDQTAITIIEWADRMPAVALPAQRSLGEVGAKAGRTWNVTIMHGATENERNISIKNCSV